MKSAKFGIVVLIVLGVWAAARSSHGQSPIVPDGPIQRDETVSFQATVRPILASNCFPCHGPDAGARQADLRLDRRSEATVELGGRWAIRPGSPDQSEVIRRLESDDLDERMPPPDSHKTVTAEQILRLRQWIAEGAEYQEHWAFVPPLRTRPPEIDATKYPAWADSPIDRFLLTRMLANGLSPSPAAPAETLIRRLYLDTIGLPPTPAELEEWLPRLRQSPLGPEGLNLQSYAALVEHLLNSPHYGEHAAQRWLDLARYADTNGYEKDRPRNIWPYRDWVIRALNRDLPFDQFTIEQLAGDLLPNPSRDQLIATGFHRNTMLNEEGGIDPLEYRFYAMTDRVATTGTTWLGLTLGCAQCHSHKYDPISHQEYYQVMALLNNAEEPELKLPSESDERDIHARLVEADRLQNDLPSRWPGGGGDDPAVRAEHLEQAFQAWLAIERQQPEWTIARPAEATSPTMTLLIEADDAVFASGDITKDDRYTLRLPSIPAGTTAIRLEALPDERLPGSGPGLAYFEGPVGDFFLGEFAVSRVSAEGAQAISIRAASESYASNHFGNAAVSAGLATDGDPQTGWSCSGRYGERHVAVFEFAAPLQESSDLLVTLRFGRHYPCSLGRFRLATTCSTGTFIAREYGPEIEDLLQRDPTTWSDEQRRGVLHVFLWQSPEMASAVEEIRQLRRRPDGASTLVFRERPPENPRPTFRHHRGEYLQPREQVAPGVPSFLPPIPPDATPADRMALARWLVSPANPLTARVQVNRAWSALFGLGLVRTAGDFGLQGDPPTHPELLDWLAVEFLANGQSLKQLHRLLVMTAAYRQSSHVIEPHRLLDPQNRWLSRASRIRLSGEQIRDLVLTASGLLDRRQFGPPVYPPQPDGATEIAYAGGSWTASTGPDRFRRAIYTFRKRTAPFAMFTTFDAPSGEVCTAQRDASNTPLQALTLLNDPALSEAAAFLGRELAKLESDDDAKIDQVYRRVLGRPPEAAEQTQLREFTSRQRARLVAGELDPHALVQASAPAAGDKAPVAGDANPEPSATELTEQAVWAITARAILNLDETITRN